MSYLIIYKRPKIIYGIKRLNLKFETHLVIYICKRLIIYMYNIIDDQNALVDGTHWQKGRYKDVDY